MVQPNLIIAGFAKCGTTAMRENIVKHPDVWMVDVYRMLQMGRTPISGGEPYFFSSKSQYKHGIDWYLELFTPGTGYTVVGEKSPMYTDPDLHGGHTALWWIHHYFPNIRLIIMIRDPIQRLYSDWAFRLRTVGGHKPPWLKDGFYESITYETAHHTGLIRSLYARAINEAFQLFGKDQVLVVSTEQIKANMRAGYKRVFDFLDLDFRLVEEDYEYHKVNPTRVEIDQRSLEFLRPYYRRDVAEVFKLLGHEILEWDV